MDLVKELIAITLDTNTSLTKDSIRWEKSIASINMVGKRICANEKWGGWEWRTKQIIKELENLDISKSYSYAIICDCYDLIFQRRPTNSEIEILKDLIVLGAEKQITGLPQFNLKYRKDWENINGGFCIGKIDNLLLFYKDVLKRWPMLKNKYGINVTDQHVISDLFIKNNLPFKLCLDINSNYILNMTRDVNTNEYFRSSQYFYSFRSNRSYFPICIHNPGNKDKPIKGLINQLDSIVEQNNPEYQ